MTQVNKAEITYYLCGGTAINIGVLLKNNSQTDNNKAAYFVGLDSSGNNSSKGLFEVERMKSPNEHGELAAGSGKVKRTNYENAPDFINEVLMKHKPSRFNVIICNTSGGTGSMLAPLLLRALEARDELYVLVPVSDMTSKVEMENAVGSLRSIANQTAKNQLDVSIPFLHFKNTPDKTRGEVNAHIVDRLNILSLFLTEFNEEMDYQDIKNLFKYNRHYGVPAALSEIRFFDQDGASEYKLKPPVAVASLFEDSDAVVPRFEGSVIRSTGVFKEGTVKPTGVKELHLVLDHGDALIQLEKDIEVLEEVRIETKGAFVTQRDLSQGADENGMIL